MPSSGAGRFEGKASPILNEIPYSFDHQATRSERCSLWIEGRQPTRNFVRVDELSNIELPRQDDLGGRRLAGAVRSADDHNILHLILTSFLPVCPQLHSMPKDMRQSKMALNGATGKSFGMPTSFNWTGLRSCG